MNLLEQTLRELNWNKKTIDDITFIGSSDGEYECSWEELKTLADIEYDTGFGGREIAGDLVIGFSDGSRLSRWEYDGSEGWEFISAIVKVPNPKKIHRLKEVYGDWRYDAGSLKTLHPE